MQNSSGNCRHLHTHLKTLAQKPEHQSVWVLALQISPQVSHSESFANMEAMRVRVRERGVGRGRGRGRGQRRGPVRRRVSDDIRATLVDHVINHGLSMREAGQRVHPNLSRYTVASIIRTFRLENRYIFKCLLQMVPTVCVTWFCIILQYYCTNCTIQKWVVLWSICKGIPLWCLQYCVQFECTVCEKPSQWHLVVAFSTEWLDDLLKVEGSGSSRNNKSLPSLKWCEKICNPTRECNNA